MPASAGPTTKIHLQILSVLEAYPDGVTAAQIRLKLRLPTEEQGQFDRRIRQLRRWFHLKNVRRGKEHFYVLGKRKTTAGASDVPRHLRAAVLREAEGRCGMCGRSIAKHGISLEIDHKVPLSWGGKTEMENLWALCEDCNQGKKNQFSSLETTPAKDVLKLKSVHVRLGELLKSNAPDPTPAWMLSFVANQSDWMKRVRDLRYLGWEITVSKKKNPSGRVEAFYKVEKWKPWPKDPTGWIRDYEARRAEANRAGKKR